MSKHLFESDEEDDDDDDGGSPGTSKVDPEGKNGLAKEIKTKDGKSIQVYQWMKRGHSTGTSTFSTRSFSRACSHICLGHCCIIVYTPFLSLPPFVIIKVRGHWRHPHCSHQQMGASSCNIAGAKVFYDCQRS